jgi:glycosyltransferase involved in cell wall biosynthesis
MSKLSASKIHLKIGGSCDSDYARDLKARYASPSIEFLGRVEANAFLDSLDLLVVPSVIEDPLPRVVHEAIGRGVPVLGSAIGGIPEMIREGETGLLVPPNDPDALRDALAQAAGRRKDLAAMSAACLKDRWRYEFPEIFGQYHQAWQGAIALRSA